MNSTMNLPYMGYSGMLSGVNGLRDPRDMDYYIADGDPVGINPLSIPGSSMPSPSPDNLTFYNRFVDSVSPSDPAPISAFQSATHTAPSSSGQGPSGRYFNPSDPAFRALYSASPDFAFNMGGYQQPASVQMHQNMAGPSRGGSSGSIPGFGPTLGQMSSIPRSTPPGVGGLVSPSFPQTQSQPMRPPPDFNESDYIEGADLDEEKLRPIEDDYQAQYPQLEDKEAEADGDGDGAEPVDNEEPLYVNAKQYHRILKRRMARARLEELNRLSRSRKPYLHESRHRHACSRPRGKGGRFLTADEIEALKKQQEAEEGSSRGQSEGSD